MRVLVGQGLNASMGDTHNLGKLDASIYLPSADSIAAWKVTYVLRGWSPLSILKTVCTYNVAYSISPGLN